MKRMKISGYICLVFLLALLIIGAVFHFTSRNAVKAESRVSYIAVNGVLQNDKAAEQYEEIIKSIRIKKVKTYFAPYSGDDVLYEIDCVVDEGKPIHILLGRNDLNIIYSGGPRGYHIENFQEILKAVEQCRG